jgi:hypothetical protein
MGGEQMIDEFISIWCHPPDRYEAGWLARVARIDIVSLAQYAGTAGP